MNRNHFTHCLVGFAAVAGLLVVSGVRAGTLVYLAAVLACPLMMIVMMRGMAGGHGHAASDHPDRRHTTRNDSTEPAERTR